MHFSYKSQKQEAVLKTWTRQDADMKMDLDESRMRGNGMDLTVLGQDLGLFRIK